ncbi:MAG: hypothetical protein JST30_00540 [Armatimonadetes bacterium]|nr:hypothetical protein [Armatimonadota bacterium]
MTQVSASYSRSRNREWLFVLGGYVFTRRIAAPAEPWRRIELSGQPLVSSNLVYSVTSMGALVEFGGPATGIPSGVARIQDRDLSVTGYDTAGPVRLVGAEAVFRGKDGALLRWEPTKPEPQVVDPGAAASALHGRTAMVSDTVGESLVITGGSFGLLTNGKFKELGRDGGAMFRSCSWVGPAESSRWIVKGGADPMVFCLLDGNLLHAKMKEPYPSDRPPAIARIGGKYWLVSDRRSFVSIETFEIVQGTLRPAGTKTVQGDPAWGRESMATHPDRLWIGTKSQGIVAVESF